MSTLDEKHRDALDDGAFAFPAERKAPIHDAAHVRAAIARFDQVEGVSDAERDAPPPIGSWVTYRFRGTHDSGLPRFASFVRVRHDMPAR